MNIAIYHTMHIYEKNNKSAEHPTMLATKSKLNDVS